MAAASSVCRAQLRHGQEPSPLPASLLCRSSTASASASVACRPGNGGLMRLKARISKKRATNSVRSSAFSVVSSSEFALKVASKFREDIFVELGKDESLSDTRGRIADVCAKVLEEYASTYSGVFTPPQPVDGMKKALQEQDLPTEKPLCCAIWWVRAHLNRDWEQFNATKARIAKL